MLNKQALLEKISQPDDRLLIAKVLDQAGFSLKKHENTFSDFCDPRKIEMTINTISGIKGIKYKVFGGFNDCERRVIGFCPDYRDIEEKDFPISVIRIDVNTKFSKELTHRDFLGSILGLGISREKIGDIFIYESYALIFAFNEISSYIVSNLTKVGHTSVKVISDDLASINLPVEKYEEKSVTISSLRVDAFLSAVFNISRGKAQDLVENEKVFVNWVSASSASKVVKEGDTISLRGFGRAKLMTVKGKTKKDRIGIIVLKYI